MSRPRIWQVFCDDRTRAKVLQHFTPLVSYESFVLISADASELRPLEDETECHDITALYDLPAQALAPLPSAHRSRRNFIDYADWTEFHHYLVQFIGPLKQEWLAGVAALGAEPRRHFGDWTFLYRSTAQMVTRIQQLPYVVGVNRMSTTSRIQLTPTTPQAILRLDSSSKPLAAHDINLPETEPVAAQSWQERRTQLSRIIRRTLKIEFFTAANLQAALPPLTTLGVQLLHASLDAATVTVRLPSETAASSSLLQRISCIHGVAAIRERPLYRTLNDVAEQIVLGQLQPLTQSQPSSSTSALNELTGRGEVIAICDTGLDTGQLDSLHLDFQGRVQAIVSYPISPAFTPLIKNPLHDDGPADVDSGHGTHVAGSAVGSGAISIGLPGVARPVQGLAPAARLFFQAVEQECRWKKRADELQYGRYLLAGLPEDLTEIFRAAYAAGARIHSNSWGGGAPGAYDDYCRQLDQFVWQHKDFCVVCAAGNDGTDFDGDGQVNPGSITSPATAKNCIAVGASESVRAEFHQRTYHELSPIDYPATHWQHAAMTDDPQQVAAFSSRGPTRDGRTKPDIVAPGTFILSTRSSQLSPQEHGWSRWPLSSQYCFLGGTSMSTPLVAGVLARIRQYLREAVGLASPTAAAVKAVLMLLARRLKAPGTGEDLPDSDQGAGLVQLTGLSDLAVRKSLTVFDLRVGLETGQRWERDFTVGDAALHVTDRPLKAVLAYSDFPGERLVNNLNLALRDPQGRWHTAHGQTGQRGLDHRNNVERLSIDRPVPGTWRLRVVASNVPQGPQDFAVAICGLNFSPAAVDPWSHGPKAT